MIPVSSFSASSPASPGTENTVDPPKNGESNAKACKESVLLFLLRPGSIIPLLVRVPVTSKNRFLRYSTRLLCTLTPGRGFDNIEKVKGQGLILQILPNDAQGIAIQSHIGGTGGSQSSDRRPKIS